MKDTTLIKLISDVRIRNIGDEVFLLPIATAGSAFYRTNKTGEIAMKFIISNSLSEGIKYEALLRHMQLAYSTVDSFTLKCDLDSFIIQLKEANFIEII